MPHEHTRENRKPIVENPSARSACTIKARFVPFAKPHTRIHPLPFTVMTHNPITHTHAHKYTQALAGIDAFSRVRRFYVLRESAERLFYFMSDELLKCVRPKKNKNVPRARRVFELRSKSAGRVAGSYAMSSVARSERADMQPTNLRTTMTADGGRRRYPEQRTKMCANNARALRHISLPLPLCTAFIVNANLYVCSMLHHFAIRQLTWKSVVSFLCRRIKTKQQQ